VDVATREGEVVVVVDLPGFQTDDIELSLADRDLTITAERDETVETNEETTFHRRERRRRSVERRVRLPEEVVDDETTATYENGVLTVTLPTLEHDDVDGTTIEVN
jgi:HSP20 family protein